MEENVPEIGPASTPPEDVNIPEDSIYGSNTPLLPNPESQTPEENASTAATSPNKSQARPQTNSIKIGLAGFLLFLAILIGLSGTGGYMAAKKTPEIQKESLEPSNLPENTPKEERGQASGFVPDRGIYQRSNTLDAKTLARSRVDLAKKRILWITDSPDSIHILPILASRKNKDSLPIFILTGKETSNHRINAAKEYNLSINQLNIELESPYSIMLIDDKLLLDISRSNWLWETKEPKILDETQNWIQELIEAHKNQ